MSNEKLESLLARDCNYDENDFVLIVYFVLQEDASHPKSRKKEAFLFFTHCGILELARAEETVINVFFSSSTKLSSILVVVAYVDDTKTPDRRTE